MTFVLRFAGTAEESLKELKRQPHLSKQFKAVTKALRFLAGNPKHPSLQTHKYDSLQGPSGEEIFEAYAEQHAPGAYRIFFFYGPQKKEIVIFAIVSHP